jgi:hypothetical protein
VAARPALRALAARLGIADAYQPMRGLPARRTSDATRIALLAAMGHEASSEAAARRALRGLADRRAARVLEPVEVLVGARTGPRRLAARSGLAPGTPLDWRLAIEAPGEAAQVREGRARAGRGGVVQLALPRLEAPGDFRVRLTLAGGGLERRAEQRLALCPARCFQVSEALGRRQGLGALVNLYALRSGRDWGVGDLGDLARLCGKAGSWGLDFVGLSPLRRRGDPRARRLPRGPPAPRRARLPGAAGPAAPARPRRLGGGRPRQARRAAAAPPPFRRAPARAGHAPGARLRPLPLPGGRRAARLRLLSSA